MDGNIRQQFSNPTKLQRKDGDRLSMQVGNKLHVLLLCQNSLAKMHSSKSIQEVGALVPCREMHKERQKRIGGRSWAFTNSLLIWPTARCNGY